MERCLERSEVLSCEERSGVERCLERSEVLSCVLFGLAGFFPGCLVCLFGLAGFFPRCLVCVFAACGGWPCRQRVSFFVLESPGHRGVRREGLDFLLSSDDGVVHY